MPCRVCCRWPRELAHVLPRRYDERRGAIAYVHPHAVIPLCPEHHAAYDRLELNLGPYLLEPEIEHAAARIGWGQALRRINGPR
jgi:hypothetical protein